MDKSEDRRDEPTRRVEKEVTIEASPEAVWEAWATARGISSFFTDSAQGEAVEGKTIYWSFEGFGPPIPYQVLRAEPGRRLTLGSEAEGRPPGVIEIEIEYRAGKTQLRLVNSGFLSGEEWDDEFRGIDSGWQIVLATLRYWLEKHPERHSKYVLFLRQPAEYRLGENLSYFVQADRLRKWLGRTDRDLAAGESFRLCLEDSSVLEGRVETVTSSEVLLSLPDPSVLIALKAFRAGPRKFLGIHGLSWLQSGQEFLKQKSGLLQGALTRLSVLLESGTQG